MDDYLKSVRTRHDARLLVKMLTELLSRGGFSLTKWMSNDRQVLTSIPPSRRAKSVVNLDLDEMPTEHALGVQWKVQTDEFCFKVIVKERPPTRRGILSVASLVYDPLGFLAPFTLSAKLILQELCRKTIGWDEKVEGQALSDWKDWLAALPELSEVAVRRCCKPDSFGEVSHAQVHHFSDASQCAYGKASYLCMIDTDGNIHCSFVIGKSRLAPLKGDHNPSLGAIGSSGICEVG